MIKNYKMIVIALGIGVMLLAGTFGVNHITKAGIIPQTKKSTIKENESASTNKKDNNSINTEKDEVVTNKQTKTEANKDKKASTDDSTFYNIDSNYTQNHQLIMGGEVIAGWKFVKGRAYQITGTKWWYITLTNNKPSRLTIIDDKTGKKRSYDIKVDEWNKDETVRRQGLKTKITSAITAFKNSIAQINFQNSPGMKILREQEERKRQAEINKVTGRDAESQIKKVRLEQEERERQAQTQSILNQQANRNIYRPPTTLPGSTNTGIPKLPTTGPNF